MNDEQLVAYCEFHCKTDKALFHKDHIRRMYALADKGYEWKQLEDNLPEYVTAKENSMMPLVNAARARLKMQPGGGCCGS